MKYNLKNYIDINGKKISTTSVSSLTIRDDVKTVINLIQKLVIYHLIVLVI